MKKICTLRNMLARSREYNHDSTALIDGERSCSFRELIAKSRRLGNALLELGLQKGDRVAFLSRNSMESGEAYLGVPNVGLIMVMLNFRLTPPELLRIIEDAEPSVIIVAEDYVEHILHIKDRLGWIKRFIYIGSRDSMPKDWLHYETIIDRASSVEPDVEICEDDLAALMYTSGTTGNPKGCMVTHRNFYHVGRSMSLEMHMTCQDTCIIPGPMFHASGVVVLMNSIYTGSTTVIMSHWDVIQFMDLVERHRVTTGILPTPMLLYFISHPDSRKYDLTSLEKVLFAGAPVSAVVFQRAIERFGNIFIHGFGTTETVGTISLLRTSDVATALKNGNIDIFKSCGRSYIDTVAEVVGDDDKPVEAGIIGEIRTKGLGTTRGYWNNEVDTRRHFRNGWYYTEDLATTDDQGFIYIVGRKKDMIITGGENVFPAEVENILFKHPDVMEAAVIGTQDPMWGEAVTAFVVKNESCELTEEELRDFCRQHIAGYKIPKRVIFVNSLPISASGKVLKSKLRELYPDATNLTDQTFPSITP